MIKVYCTGSGRRISEFAWFLQKGPKTSVQDCGGSNIGMERNGMRNKMEVGYRIKICWWDWDVLISIGGKRDSCEIVGGMWDLNSQ